MEVFREIEPLKRFLFTQKEQQASIGLVPTMGALHSGHMALIRTAKAENTLVVCSIYVNPTQFNNAEELDRYPRTESRDRALLESEQCDILFIPDHTEMYATIESHLQFDFGPLSEEMEGRFRPGHFSGVALVVSKFFNIVQPDSAYFGQKDYQQFKIISFLKEELKFSINLHSVPTVRESDGLALSSRNQWLIGEDRKHALAFFKALDSAKKKLSEGISFGEIRKEVQHQFDQLNTIRLEYFELARCENLSFLDDLALGDHAILLIAGYVGNVRLIDNMLVDNS